MRSRASWPRIHLRTPELPPFHVKHSQMLVCNGRIYFWLILHLCFQNTASILFDAANLPWNSPALVWFIKKSVPTWILFCSTIHFYPCYECSLGKVLLNMGGWGKGIIFDELPCTGSLFKSIRDQSDIYKRFVLCGFNVIILSFSSRNLPPKCSLALEGGVHHHSRVIMIPVLQVEYPPQSEFYPRSQVWCSAVLKCRRILLNRSRRNLTRTARGLLHFRWPLRRVKW